MHLRPPDSELEQLVADRLKKVQTDSSNVLVEALHKLKRLRRLDISVLKLLVPGFEMND